MIAGNHRHPEHQAKVILRRRHQRHRQQRPGKAAHRIQRLAQAIGRAANFRRRDVGDQRIARRAAYALADAVDKPRREHRADAGAPAETAAWSTPPSP
jgi:hypothetical protein